MFTYSFYIAAHRGNTLMLRLYNNRKKTELSMGLRVDEDSFADAISPCPQSGNCELSALLSQWRTLIDAMKISFAKEGRGDEDVKSIKEIIRTEILGEKPSLPEPAPKPKVGTFLKFFDEHTQRYDRRSTRESNEYTRKIMVKFAQSRGAALDALNFEDIKFAWLSDLESYMKKSGLSVNTRRIHFANIRAAINDAYRRELTDVDPFRRFRLKTEKTAKRSMSLDDLRELFEYPAEPHAIYYRDMFKLIFMLIGINTVDLYGLKGINSQGRIEYKRAKTGRLYSIKAEPEAMEIIERYRGVSALLNIADKYKDHRYFRRDTNDALRHIGEVRREGRGGKKIYSPLWPELTTYWARHTWATIAADLDIPDATISLALGHAGENRVTDIYIKRNRNKIDEANRKVLDWVLYGKR